MQMGDITSAIKNLKKGKDNGNVHLVSDNDSDHVIMSTDKCKCLFALLV